MRFDFKSYESQYLSLDRDLQTLAVERLESLVVTNASTESFSTVSALQYSSCRDSHRQSQLHLLVCNLSLSVDLHSMLASLTALYQSIRVSSSFFYALYLSLFVLLARNFTPTDARSYLQIDAS